MTLPALPINITFKLDNHIEVQSTTTQPDGSTLCTLRLGPNGSILTTLPFRAMRVRTGKEAGVFIQGDKVGEVQKLMMPVVVGGLYPDSILRFEIFISGVVFDDGTLSKKSQIPRRLFNGGRNDFEFLESE
jgi:hypothetical protein